MQKFHSKTLLKIIPYLKQSDLFVLSSRYEVYQMFFWSPSLKKISISSSCPTGQKKFYLMEKAVSYLIGNYKELSKKYFLL